MTYTREDIASMALSIHTVQPLVMLGAIEDRALRINERSQPKNCAKDILALWKIRAVAMHKAGVVAHGLSELLLELERTPADLELVQVDMHGDDKILIIFVEEKLERIFGFIYKIQ